MGSREFYAHIWALTRHLGHMAYMLDSDWLKKFLLRSDWLGPSVALYTTGLFTDTATILNLLDLRSIYEMPRGQSLSIYARFSGKKRTSLCISREKAIIITSKHGTTMFFPITIFF